MDKGSVVLISSRGSKAATNFDGEVFKVTKISGRYAYANIVGSVDAEGRFMEYSVATRREKNRTSPEYFDVDLYSFELFAFKVRCSFKVPHS